MYEGSNNLLINFSGVIKKNIITMVLKILQMGKVFGCSMPFLKPDPRFGECRLDQMDEAKRLDMRTYYAGIFYQPLSTVFCNSSCRVLVVRFTEPYIE